MAGAATFQILILSVVWKTWQVLPPTRLLYGLILTTLTRSICVATSTPNVSNTSANETRTSCLPKNPTKLMQGFPILAETAPHLPPPTPKKMELAARAGRPPTPHHLHPPLCGGSAPR